MSRPIVPRRRWVVVVLKPGGPTKYLVDAYNNNFMIDFTTKMRPRAWRTQWMTADHNLLCWGLNLEGHNSKAFVMSMLMAHSGGLPSSQFIGWARVCPHPQPPGPVCLTPACPPIAIFAGYTWPNFVNNHAHPLPIWIALVIMINIFFYSLYYDVGSSM